MGVTPFETREWEFSLCTLDVDVGDRTGVELRGRIDTPGWSLILLDESAMTTPGMLEAGDTTVTVQLTEENREIRFLMGIRRSCTAFPQARFQLEVTADGGEADTETFEHTTGLPLELAVAPPPVANLRTVHRDTERAPVPTVIRIAWDSAPVDCGWQLLVTLTDPGEAPWEVAAIEGAPGATATMNGGEISVHVPAYGGRPSDGTLAIVLLPTGDDSAEMGGAVLVEVFSWP